jgi:hypothetical protein
LHLQQRFVSSVIGLHTGCLCQRERRMTSYLLVPVVEHIGYV